MNNVVYKNEREGEHCAQTFPFKSDVDAWWRNIRRDHSSTYNPRLYQPSTHQRYPVPDSGCIEVHIVFQRIGTQPDPVVGNALRWAERSQDGKYRPANHGNVADANSAGQYAP